MVTVSALLIATLMRAASADAQDATDTARNSDDIDEVAPDFEQSIDLHIAAVSTTIAGTVGVPLAFFGVFTCDSDTCGYVWAAVGVTSIVLTVVGFALGIAASVTHSDTRSRSSRAALPVLPLVWVDPQTGGGGLELRMQM